MKILIGLTVMTVIGFIYNKCDITIDHEKECVFGSFKEEEK